MIPGSIFAYDASYPIAGEIIDEAVEVDLEVEKTEGKGVSIHLKARQRSLDLQLGWKEAASGSREPKIDHFELAQDCILDYDAAWLDVAVDGIVLRRFANLSMISARPQPSYPTIERGRLPRPFEESGDRLHPRCSLNKPDRASPQSDGLL